MMKVRLWGVKKVAQSERGSRLPGHRVTLQRAGSPELNCVGPWAIHFTLGFQATKVKIKSLQFQKNFLGIKKVEIYLRIQLTADVGVPPRAGLTKTEMWQRTSGCHVLVENHTEGVRPCRSFLLRSSESGVPHACRAEGSVALSGSNGRLVEGGREEHVETGWEMATIRTKRKKNEDRVKAFCQFLPEMFISLIKHLREWHWNLAFSSTIIQHWRRTFYWEVNLSLAPYQVTNSK